MLTCAVKQSKVALPHHIVQIASSPVDICGSFRTHSSLDRRQNEQAQCVVYGDHHTRLGVRHLPIPTDYALVVLAKLWH
jgi:hypothetical protein